MRLNALFDTPGQIFHSFLGRKGLCNGLFEDFDNFTQCAILPINANILSGDPDRQGKWLETTTLSDLLLSLLVEREQFILKLGVLGPQIFNFSASVTQLLTFRGSAMDDFLIFFLQGRNLAPQLTYLILLLFRLIRACR